MPMFLSRLVNIQPSQLTGPGRIGRFRATHAFKAAGLRIVGPIQRVRAGFVISVRFGERDESPQFPEVAAFAPSRQPLGPSQGPPLCDQQDTAEVQGAPGLIQG